MRKPVVSMDVRLHELQSFLYASVCCFVPSGRPSGYFFLWSPTWTSGDCTVGWGATAVVCIDLSASMPTLSVHSDAAGSHLLSGECAPATALSLLDHQSLLSDLPPPKDTLFQVVAQEEVASAVDGPLTEGVAIQAIFDPYATQRPEAGSAGMLTHSAAPLHFGSHEFDTGFSATTHSRLQDPTRLGTRLPPSTLAATSLTQGSLPRPTPRVRRFMTRAGYNLFLTRQ